MISQTWAEWIAPNPSTMRLSIGPVQSVLAIKYYDTNNTFQTDNLSNYLVMGTPSHKIVKPKSGYSWPTVFVRDDAIKIVYAVGYDIAASDVPQTVRHALMMLVGYYNENHESELNRRITFYYICVFIYLNNLFFIKRPVKFNKSIGLPRLIKRLLKSL